ncbi:Smr/MutS family protein [Roseobacter sp. HKCCA0434]|uniref:Smr/MutS family protein n=1 Tax=Roseobacter sp. HKCCA0434 TaxID=3079297 RepID=UPI002905BE17|nr:Smr/MutS family protein [Roseobacter sp. HKCCA0434]
MPRRRRKLSAEERELWSRVADSTSPLNETAPTPPDDAREEMSPIPEPKVRPKGITLRPEGRPGPRTGFDPAPPPGREALAMDRRAFEKMVRGNLRPDARLDLHGMTVAAAHDRLRGFVLRAHSNGARLLLVITGKGKRGAEDAIIPERHGVLRHQVPHWLRLPPLGPLVLQVAPAHRRHGGEGAYYVYLRRMR